MQPLIYILLSFASWGAALYFFFNKSISWAVSNNNIYMWLGFLRHVNVAGCYHNTNTELDRKCMYNVTVMHLQVFALLITFNPQRVTIFLFFMFGHMLCI